MKTTLLVVSCKSDRNIYILLYLVKRNKNIVMMCLELPILKGFVIKVIMQMLSRKFFSKLKTVSAIHANNCKSD